MTENRERPSEPLVCDLTALDPADRDGLLAGLPVLFAAVETVQELADGYAFRFAAQPGRLLEIAEYVERERQCCPFYAFAIELEPAGGPVWLRLTGPDGVKAFIEGLLADLARARSAHEKQEARPG